MITREGVLRQVTTREGGKGAHMGDNQGTGAHICDDQVKALGTHTQVIIRDAGLAWVVTREGGPHARHG